MVKNLFGDLALDTSMKFLKNIISRFTFDAAGQLRVGGSVGVSSLPTLSTVTTVGTVNQANISIGDTGRPATAIVMSAQMFYATVGANFIRS